MVQYGDLWVLRAAWTDYLLRLPLSPSSVSSPRSTSSEGKATKRVRRGPGPVSPEGPIVSKAASSGGAQRTPEAIREQPERAAPEEVQEVQASAGAERVTGRQPSPR